MQTVVRDLGWAECAFAQKWIGGSAENEIEYMIFLIGIAVSVLGVDYNNNNKHICI